MNKYRNKDLTELINLAKNDDKNALEELVKRYGKKVYATFSSLNPNADLSDLTQEALYKMTKSIKTLKNPEKFNSWLNNIVHNLFYDVLRHNKNRRFNCTSNPMYCENQNFEECIIDEHKTPDENTIDCELKRKINKAVSELSPIFKTIIILREFEGLSYEQIADLTNLKINTVKSRLARARIKLKRELEPYFK